MNKSNDENARESGHCSVKPNVIETMNTGETNEDVLLIMETVIRMFLVQFVSLAGCLGNLLTVIVLSTSKLRDTSSVVLLSLAACDLFLLVSLLVFKLDNFIALIDPIAPFIYHAYTYTYIGLPGRVAAIISMSHIVVISFERLAAVFYPLLVSQIITRKKIVTALVCIYSGWILCLLPGTYFYIKPGLIFNIFYNKSLHSVQATKWSMENMYVLNMLDLVVLNTITGLFPVVVAANCCAIAHKLQFASKQRHSMTCTNRSDNGNDVKVSRMLLTLCIVFCATNFPCAVIKIYMFADFSMKPSMLDLLIELCDLFIAINSAANFFVYIVMSTKFYKSVVNMLTCSFFHRIVKIQFN